MLIGYAGDTPGLEDDAKGILSLIWNCYPNHPWHVECKHGLVFIKYLGFDSNYGMALRVTEADHDAAVFKKKLVMLAGEWLERAGLARGKGDDTEISRVEGVPEKKAVNFAVEVEKSDIRDEPRPQVKGLLDG